jgi:UPF0755 protein
MGSFRKMYVVVLLGALVAGGGTGFLWLNQPPGTSSRVQLVDIPPGTTFTHMVTILHQQNLIRFPWFISLLGRLQNLDRKIFPGEYELHAGMTATAILKELAQGRLYRHTVTIPEGYSTVQIAELLQQKGLADQEEVLRLSRDQAFLQRMDVEGPSLEGYLFPDTYQFARYTPAETILKTFLNRFHDMVTPAMREEARKRGMTLPEVLTLASVVEKETGLPAERPLVAGVFHNRLKRNIPLQSDPTVIYALENFDGNIRKADLSVDSPYNTYRVRGLPPGPIANPGLESINAVLYPAATEYVYFVSRNDGSHEFSETLAEHNRAVEKYQRRNKPRQAS